MRIISLILLVFGFMICVVSALGTRFSLSRTLESMMSAETTGIAMLAQGLETISLLSYVNIFGCVILFLGILLNIVSMFTARNRQQAI